MPKSWSVISQQKRLVHYIPIYHFNAYVTSQSKVECWEQHKSLIQEGK